MNGLAEIGEFMNILYEQKGELEKNCANSRRLKKK